MEWLSAIRAAIDYMENHLTDNISAQDVAGQVYLSPFFFQRGFSLMTGYGIGEYLRNRRLYLAALDLQRTDAVLYMGQVLTLKLNPMIISKLAAHLKEKLSRALFV